MCELLLQFDGASVLRLLCLQSLKLRWVINICLLYIISIYTWWGLFSAIVLKSTTNTWFYYFSLLIITKRYLYHKFRINCFVIFCNTIFLLHTSTSMTFRNLQSPTQIKHLKTGIYQGSADCYKGGCDSTLNSLD